MIYVIISGEYSDQNIIGYCTTEEAAARICQLYDSPSLSYHYEEVGDCLDERAREMVQFKYVVTFTACLSNQSCNYYYSFSGAEYIGMTQDIGASNVNIEPTNNHKMPFVARVTVSVRDYSEELAKKVAYDTLYKYLSESEGL
jgi:hypothetical protein